MHFNLQILRNGKIFQKHLCSNLHMFRIVSNYTNCSCRYKALSFEDTIRVPLVAKSTQTHHKLLRDKCIIGSFYKSNELIGSAKCNGATAQQNKRAYSTHYSNIDNYYPADIIEKARELLKPLGGGAVSLVKDNSSGVATITLQHPERKNALSGRMMVELMDIICELELWKDGRGVLLQSEGDFFCSGGDLTTVSSICNPEDGYLMATFMHNTLTRLRCLPLVSVCLVQGRALGGGAEITTATDFRLLTRDGEIGFVQGVMGVSPGWGGGTRLVKLVGAKKALELMLTSKKVDANTALRIGLAEEIINTNEARQEAEKWLANRIVFAPEVIHAMKRLIVAAENENMHESLKFERSVFAPLWGGPANRKALGKNIKH